MSATTAAWLVLAAPARGRRSSSRSASAAAPAAVAGWIGTVAIAASFVCALGALIELQDRAEDAAPGRLDAVDYANTVGVDAKLTILVDPLSVLMILVVTGVSMLIHLYSVTYMTATAATRASSPT